jgi:hypothetical protein
MFRGFCMPWPKGRSRERTGEKTVRPTYINSKVYEGFVRDAHKRGVSVRVALEAAIAMWQDAVEDGGDASGDSSDG